MNVHEVLYYYVFDTKEEWGLTEMDNYMREFIVGLKELKTLLPLCNGERLNRLWKGLTE